MAPKKAKKTADSINSRLALVMKSGKVTLGYKSTLKALRCGCFSKPVSRPLESNESGTCSEVLTQDSVEGEACHHSWQHSSSPQERTRILFYALQDQRPPLRWQQREFKRRPCEEA